MDASLRDTHSVKRSFLLDTFGPQSSNKARLQHLEKEINCCNSAVSGNDENSTGVSRRLAKATRYPLDPAAIHFLGSAFG